MRKYLLIIFLLPLFAKGQYGNQDSIVVPTASYTQSTVKGLISLPPDYSTSSKTYPLLLNFEGNGQAGTQLKELYNATGMICDYLKAGANISAVNPVDSKRYDFIVFSPLPTHTCSSCFSDWFNVTNVKPMLANLKSRYRIDPTRVYITGLSAGGFTSLSCLLQDVSFASQFAATVLASAQGDGSFPALLCNIPINKIAYWAIFEQGEDKASFNRQYVAGINACIPAPVIPAIKTELPGSNHDGWLYAYDSTFKPNGLNYLEWLLQYTTGAPATGHVSITNVTASPYCITAVSGKTISVSFSTDYTPNSGNQYIIQLSSPSGSFLNPTNLLTIPSTSTSVTANVTIPANITPGTAYRLRVTATSPVITGSQNSAPLTVILAKNSIAPTGTQNIAVNSNGTTLTGSFGSTPNSNQWYDGANPIAGATGSTYTPNFTDAGAHSVTLHSTYTTCATTVISNAVIINTALVSSSVHYVTKNPGDSGVFLSACNGYQYNPGDTFKIRSSLGPYSYIEFDCFNNIVITNEGGQVLSMGAHHDTIQGGITLYNCNNVHLTGTGDVNYQYGFKLTSGAYRGIGVNVLGRSSYIEIDHVEVYRKNTGIKIKMEQVDDKCDTNYAFPRWYLHHMSIHDNWLHGNAAESVYGLSTDPNGGRTSSTHYCNGVLDTLLAMRGYAFHIYNNYIDSNGRALQLAAADLDVSEINNNIVLHTGWDPDALQGNGISLGTYCRAYVHHNYINWSKKDGIQAFGAFNRIENNTVHNSGNDGFGHTTTASNIYVSSRNALYPSPENGTYDSTQFIVRDNDLDSNSSGWNVFVETGTGRFKNSGNLICNNTHDVDFVRPTINYSADCGGRQYVLIYRIGETEHDSTYLHTFHTTAYYDSVVTSFKDTTKSKFKNYKFAVRIATTTTKTFQLQRDSTYDSVVHYWYIHDSIFVDTQWINTNAFKLGAFYFSNGTVSITNQIDTVKNYLGMDYMRQNITRGGGAGYNVKQANDSGLHVVLTVNNSSDGASGFNTYLSGLVATDKPEVVCVGNEEPLNSTNLPGYISDLQTAVTTLHPLGIKVSNGGITPDVAFYMYDYWNTHGKQDSALKLKQAFALNTTSQQATDAIATYKVLIPAYAASGMDFFNVHVHEPIRDTSITLISPWFPILINFLRERMGLGFIVGEFGTWNHNCQLLTDFVNEIFASGAEYAIYFDGTGNAGQDVKLQDCMKGIVSNLHSGNLVFQDEFDDINTTYWSKQAIHVDSIYSTTAFAHSGSNSAKFSYDYSDWTDDSTLQPQGHRTEIQGKGTAPPGQFALGSVYWLGFSTYFPSTWQVDPTNALIWQFHGKNGEDGNPVGAGAGGTPALSANVRPNQDSISVFVKYDSISPSQDGFLSLLHVPLVRNTWMNWVLQIKFDYTNGFVNAWVNGAQKCSYVGPTIYHSVNQASETGPYFKMGIYKAMWGTVPNIGQASNLTLYYDNLKIGSGFSSFNEVSP